MTKRTISRRVFLGDSLSDRGTLERRKLLDFIPMSVLSGLSSKSPRGRFTNGFLWGDFISATAIEQLEIDRVRRKRHFKNTAVNNADLADEVLTNAHHVRTKNEDAFSLDEDKQVLYEGHRFARFYCEGGLTAHDYSKELTFDLPDEGAREIVSTLTKKREQLLEDDRKYKISTREKQETLITEWSGANDLITVNKEPTHKEADKAVAARIANLEALINSGYTNFVLMNLPDLSLTPRFQRKDGKARENAQECSKYFNDQLAIKCQELREKYQHLKPALFIDIFDVSGLLTQVYQNPQEYGFDKDKLAKPYTESKEFKKNKANPVDKAMHISPSKGYMFWDDVHPTADMHAWLGEKFKEKYDSIFKYESPAAKTSIEEQTTKKAQKEIADRLNLEIETKLPGNIIKHLRIILLSTTPMTRSTDPIRRKKAQFLEELVDTIYEQAGDLEKIREKIVSFQSSPKRMSIIKKHQNPILDFFIFKRTTQSEDNIKALLKAVETQIQLNDAKKEKEFRLDIK